jgi:hypothetical protein
MFMKKLICKIFWHNITWASTIEANGLELWCKNCDWHLDFKKVKHPKLQNK